MARGIDFRKLRFGEYTVPSNLCICQYPSEVRISVSLGKGLNFITNAVFLLLKYDGNYNWQDFHSIRKARM